MTVNEIYPPIALATILAGIWFMVAYRLHLRDGEESSVAQIAWMSLLPGGLAFSYFILDETNLKSSWQVLFAAIIGIVMGGAFLFGIHFLAKKKQPPTVIAMIGGSMFVLLTLFSVALIR